LLSAFFPAEEEFAGQMAPNCSPTSRRERRRTRAAGRYFEPAMYNSSPRPPRNASFVHAAGSPLPVRGTSGAKVYYPYPKRSEVKNPGSPPTHAPPRTSLQGDCLLNGIGWFIFSAHNLTENTQPRAADGSGRKRVSSGLGKPCVKTCAKRDVRALILPHDARERDDHPSSRLLRCGFPHWSARPGWHTRESSSQGQILLYC
jgi:hypothetical protein